MTEDNLLSLGSEVDNTPVAPAMGVAMIALNMALKYHDINTVQDGTLYQQYKLEGRNLHALHLDHVFETAKRIEMHLLTSSHEIAKLMDEGVIDALMAEEPDAAEAADDTLIEQEPPETEVPQ